MQTTGPTDPPDPIVDTLEHDRPAGAGAFRGAARRRGLTAALAALALLAAGATGVALADEGPGSGTGASSSASADADRTGESRWRRDHVGMGRGLRAAGPVLGHLHGLHGGALHGEFVTEDPDGGYRTLLVQGGKASGVSASSITVTSEDGFVATYSVTGTTRVLSGAGGVADIKAGAQVSVTAVKSGAGARALSVADVTGLRERLRDFRGGPRVEDHDTTTN